MGGWWGKNKKRGGGGKGRQDMMEWAPRTLPTALGGSLAWGVTFFRWREEIPLPHLSSPNIFRRCTRRVTARGGWEDGREEPPFPACRIGGRRARNVTAGGGKGGGTGPGIGGRRTRSITATRKGGGAGRRAGPRSRDWRAPHSERYGAARRGRARSAELSAVLTAAGHGLAAARPPPAPPRRAAPRTGTR